MKHPESRAERRHLRDIYETKKKAPHTGRRLREQLEEQETRDAIAKAYADSEEDGLLV